MARAVPRKAERIANGALDDKTPGKTIQTFKNECDINRVLDRAKAGAGLSHLLNHQGSYGDFSAWDENTHENMQNELARANGIFYDLPSEIRLEFNNNPGRFFQFVNDPANSERLPEIFPELARPGRQLMDPTGPPAAAASGPQGASTDQPEAVSETPAETPETPA